MLPPPPIQGIGNAGGFTMQVELRDGSTDFAKLQSVTNAIVANAQSQSALQRVLDHVPRRRAAIRVEVDRIKAETLHVSVDQVFSTLATYLGSTYVEQFNKFGRVFQVYAQADAPFRLRPRDIENLYGAQPAGQHDAARHGGQDRRRRRPAADQPLQSLSVSDRDRAAGGGLQFGRGDTSDGGDAAQTLPPGAATEWTAMSYQEKVVGHQMYFVFAMALAAGLSGARRPIRELVRAALGDPLGAAGAGRSGAGALGAAHRQQSLHPDRHHPADRAVGQERHPDRRGGARHAACTRTSRSSKPRSRRRGRGSGRSS